MDNGTYSSPDGNNNLPFQRELDVATGAVRVAAKLSQHIINAKEQGGVISKDDLTPVTLADFAIQALLSATIRAQFPEDRIVGEEDASQLRTDLLLLEHVYDLLRWAAGHGEGPDAEARREAFPKDCRVPSSREHMCDLIDECGASVPGTTGRTWVFDPIDGTKTYVRGELYAINIALLVDGKQTVSVVGCPNLSIAPVAPLRDSHVHEKGTIAFAVKGSGAFVQSISSGSGTGPMRLRHLDPSLGLEDVRFVSCTTVDSALAGVNKEVARRIDHAVAAAEFPTCDLLPWVLRWVALARGLGNTTVWIYKSKERLGKIWDHAGAMLLFEETGGVVTDVLGQPIELAAGRKMKANFGFVAAPPQLHGEVLRTAQAVVREMGREELLQGWPPS
jgi:3'(2'), 5'-bisphosphate nucleotidase